MTSFKDELDILITAALKEDIGDGDHSTLCCIPSDKKGKAVLKIKDDGILAGVELAEYIIKFNTQNVLFKKYKNDGDRMKYGEIAFELETFIHTILKCERLILNCMQRMSGIATLTREYTDKLKGYKTQLLDTRKTTPNFRILEKEAVGIGGGVNHRFGLFDMIMLKDNHIDYCGGIENAIEKAYLYVKEYRPDLKIEIETRTMEDVKTVCKSGKNKIFRVMLDNFTPKQIVEALAILEGNFETEASGGINLQNIQEYAETGVDYVSAGAVIHQAKSLDLSLKAEL
jgi:nicotinate-nucleotide pyrophosphorylase (carboxylating)